MDITRLLIMPMSERDILSEIECPRILLESSDALNSVFDESINNKLSCTSKHSTTDIFR